MWCNAKFVRVVEPGEEHGVIGVQLKDNDEIFILEDGDKIRIWGFSEMKVEVVPIIPEDLIRKSGITTHQMQIGSMKSLVKHRLNWTHASWVVVINEGNYPPDSWGVELWMED